MKESTKMSRPTTKVDLVTVSNQKFSELEKLLHSMTELELERTFNFDKAFLEKQQATHWQRDKNLRDVLIHLYEWHQLLLNWVANNKQGQGVSFLPEPYNWRTYPKMNIEFLEKHQQTSYHHAKELLEQSHVDIMKVINSFSNDELFAKEVLKWTGNTSLGSYCISVTSSHYDWAIKKIKKHIKTLPKQT